MEWEGSYPTRKNKDRPRSYHTYLEKSDKPSAAVGKWRGKRRKGTLTEERTVAELNKTQAPIARAQ